jgi:hypothetical protein
MKDTTMKRRIKLPGFKGVVVRSRRRKPRVNMSEALGLAPRKIQVTFFVNQSATSLRCGELTSDELAHMIRKTNAPRKASLPWLKLARFGDQRTQNDSLRHNGNVVAVTGCEGDYDDEETTFEDAVAIIRRARLQTIMYTSPSHTAAKPRWRILAPSSRDLLPEERTKLVERLNGLLGGTLGPESFVLSQAYYYGKVSNSSQHEVVVTEGDYIDQRVDLDATAISKESAKSEKKGNGHANPWAQLGEDQSSYREPTVAELMACARVAPNDDLHWDDWNKIGLSIASAFPDENGFAAFDLWSQKSSKYDAQRTARKWAAILKCPPRGSEDGGVTIGTFFALGYEGDPHWRDPFKTQVDATAPTPTPTLEQPWPVMDPAAYYGLAGKVVELYAPHTEADRNALLLHFLCFFGNMIDRKVFQWIDGNRHHGNIFILIAGDSGISRKGTAAARMREFIRLVDPIWVEECIKGGASSGEGIIFNIRDEITKTKESGEEVVVVDGVDDKRLLLLETEFGSVLTVMKREQNILSHILRQAWDSGVLQTLVKNNPNRCVEPHVSLVGHVTIEELRHQLDQISMANGLCNRLLIACTRRAQLLPFGSSPDQTEVATLASEVKIAFHRVYLVNKELTMVQPDARALWDRIYSELHHNSKPGLAGAIVARSDAQTKRLAALYALLDGVDDIRVEHLTAARAVTKFCEGSADFIFGDTVGERTADEIQRSLHASGSMTRTDIYRAFACNVSSAKIGAALAMLERLGRARREMRPPPPGTKGRPTEFWVAV